jgi:hypothetical protein
MDTRSKGGAPVPDGDYLAEVVSIVDGESSQKKSPQLNVQMEVHEGPHKGGRLLDFIPMSENSAFRSANFFWACGVDEPGESDIDTDSISRLNADGDEVNAEGALIRVKKVTQDDPSAKNGKRISLFYSRVEQADASEAETEAEAEVEAPAPAPVKVAGAPKPGMVKKPIGRPPGKKITIKA